MFPKAECWTHNTVPGYCEVRVNFRFTCAKEQEVIAQYMQELEKTVYVPGCRTEMEVYGSRPAMERVERNLELLDTVNGIFEKNGLSTFQPIMKQGGSDASQITTAGIPCLDGFGVRGGNVHSPNEFGVLESLREAAKRLAAITYSI